MKTHWLIGKEGYQNALPTFDTLDDDRLVKLLDESQVK